MNTIEQCERFNSRYSKLNDFGKQYIEAILQSLEFAQDTAAHMSSALPKQNEQPRKPPTDRPA